MGFAMALPTFRLRMLLVGIALISLLLACVRLVLESNTIVDTVQVPDESVLKWQSEHHPQPVDSRHLAVRGNRP